jgi:hypothetical protein
MQFISPYLVHQADAPSFLTKIDQNTAALFLNLAKRLLKLEATVTAQ